MSEISKVSRQNSRSSACSKYKPIVASQTCRLKSNKLKLNVHNGKFILPGPAPNQYKPNVDSICPRAPAASFGYKHSLNKLVIFQENDCNYYIDFSKTKGNNK